MTKTITLSGGFHNAAPLRIRARVLDGNLMLSEGQRARIVRHMCGSQSCCCGIRHGWIVDGAARGELPDAIHCAAIARSR